MEPQAARSGPLSAEDLRALSEGRGRARKVRRAAGVAALSGWTMAVFGAVGLLAAVFGDWVSAALGAALVVLGWNELQGGAMLRRLDARGAARLGWNQIVLGVVLVAYAAWSLATTLRSPALAAVGGTTGDAGIDAMVTQMTGVLAYSLYGTLCAAGVVVPGLTAWYYFTRERVVREVLAGTPEWVVEAMRAAG